MRWASEQPSLDSENLGGATLHTPDDAVRASDGHGRDVGLVNARIHHSRAAVKGEVGRESSGP